MSNSLIMTTFLTMVFLFDYPIEKNLELTRLGGLCSDIGKKIIDNLADCENAAVQLGGYVYKNVKWDTRPKGCSWLHYSTGTGEFWWNSHNTGSRNKDHRAICTRRGNCNFHNWVELTHINLYKYIYIFI